MTSVNLKSVTIVNVEFTDWVQQRIEDSGITHAEFAKKAAVSKSLVSLIFSGKRKVTPKFCFGVAKAFNLDESYVLVKAGLSKPKNTLSESSQEIVEIFERLNDNDKNKVVSFAKFLLKEPV